MEERSSNLFVFLSLKIDGSEDSHIIGNSILNLISLTKRGKGAGEILTLPFNWFDGLPQKLSCLCIVFVAVTLNHMFRRYVQDLI